MNMSIILNTAGVLVFIALGVFMHYWAQVICKEYHLTAKDDWFAIFALYFLGVLPCALIVVGLLFNIIDLIK